MSPSLIPAEEIAQATVAEAIQPAPVAARKVREDLRMGREYQQGRINWITAIAMALFHVGAIAALFFFSWTNLAVAVVMYFFAINVGIGMA
ncbi:MAG TPA: hypothetical protein VK596_01925, partial [Edaphobacter sp.]|nr:hypothetical protein [Edaphobacter sp.]